MDRQSLLERAMELVEADEGDGICMNCGHEQCGVEPDARGYECEHCGKMEVMGAEEVILELA